MFHKSVYLYLFMYLFLALHIYFFMWFNFGNFIAMSLSSFISESFTIRSIQCISCGLLNFSAFKTPFVFLILYVFSLCSCFSSYLWIYLHSCFKSVSDSFIMLVTAEFFSIVWMLFSSGYSHIFLLWFSNSIWLDTENL